MRKKTRKIVYPILLVIVLFLLAGLILQRNQRMLIFRPTKLSKSFQFHFDRPFKEFNIPIADSSYLNMLLIQAEDPKGIVIYFHGNTGNMATQSGHIPIFLQHHYDVLMMDYPGFGKSTGPNSELDLYNDGLVSYQLAKNYFPADSIIIYGRSLGTAIAAELASKQACKMLILESPFYSMDDLAKRYFPFYPVSYLLRYHFPIYHFVPRVKSTVIIFHGKEDKIVRYKESVKLKPLLKNGDKYITLENGSHNMLYKHPLYRSTMDSLLNL